MKTGSRIGWFALCLAALIAAFFMQIVGTVVGMIAHLFMSMKELNDQGLLTEDAANEVMNNAPTDGMGIMLIFAHIAMLIGFAVWYRIGCGKPRFTEAKAVFAPKPFLVVLLVAGGMCFVTNFGLPLAALVIPESIMENYEALMEQAGFGVDTLAIIASVLLAPFGEEFICRGVIFHYAKKAVSDLENRRKAFWIANTVQAVAFGVLHGNIVQGSYAFVMGLALGYLRHRYNSVVPAIMGHMLINAISTFAWEPIASHLPESYVVCAIGTAVSLVIVFLGLYIGGPAEQKKVAVTEMAAE